MTAPARTRVTSPYGYSPGYNGFHNGIDFAHIDPNNTPVFAFRAGRVVHVGVYPGWEGRGIVVVIDHGGGVVSWSCHLRAATVTVGQQVAAGQRVGTMGATGAALGIHLHWMVCLNGVAVDPTPYLMSSAGGGTTPFIPEEDDMPLLIKHPDNSVGLLSDGGILDPISSMTEVESLQYTGLVGPIKEVSSLVWDTLTARSNRLQAVGQTATINYELLAKALAKEIAVPTAEQNGAAARAAIVK